MTMTATTIPEPDTLRNRLRRLGLYGLLTQVDEILEENWLPRLLDIEEAERQRRSSNGVSRTPVSAASNPWRTSTGNGPRRSTAN